MVLPGARAPITKVRDTLIIGIDLATTKICVAFATKSVVRTDHPSKPEVFRGWSGSYETPHLYPITAIYFDNGGNVLTGTKLQKILAETHIEQSRFFPQWKLLYHDSDLDENVCKIQREYEKRLNAMGKTRKNLLEEFVSALYYELFEENSNCELQIPLRLRNSYFDTPPNIEIVVAVPPGRALDSHDEILRGFVQKGITESQVSLASEPEGLFRSWIADGENQRDWQVGKLYLVVDGGGGTCCLVSYILEKLEPGLSFRQVHKSRSIVCGAETISDMFEEVAISMLPPSLGEELRARYIMDLRRQFNDKHKENFGDVDLDYTFIAPWDKNKDLKISPREVQPCFDPCVDKCIAGIEEQCSKVKSVDYLVLGGGLFQNRYVVREIKRKFEERFEICSVSRDKSHVARGAVLTRLSENFITKAPRVYSKGIVTLRDLTPTIRDSALCGKLCTKQGVDGKCYFWCVEWLFKGRVDGSVTYDNGWHEPSDEASFKNARTRPIDPSATKLEFKEQIVTILDHPGESSWAALVDSNTGLMDPSGKILPEYTSETLTWSPPMCGPPQCRPGKCGGPVKCGGVLLSDLETKTRSGRRFHILRYSPRMKMQEVGHRYQMKVWVVADQNIKDPKKRKAVYTTEVKRDFHGVSHNLLRSIELADEIDETDDTDNYGPAQNGIALAAVAKGAQKINFSSYPAARKRIVTGEGIHVQPAKRKTSSTSHLYRGSTLSQQTANSNIPKSKASQNSKQELSRMPIKRAKEPLTQPSRSGNRGKDLMKASPDSQEELHTIEVESPRISSRSANRTEEPNMIRWDEVDLEGIEM